MRSQRLQLAVTIVGAWTVACSGNSASPSASGGSPATGGTPTTSSPTASNGGTNATDGAATLGGATPSTGSSWALGGTRNPSDGSQSITSTTGGTAANSAASGGVLAGGAASGGGATTKAFGGAWMGGATSGGKATGGAASGGLSAGGTATSGKVAGGNSSGGSSAGLPAGGTFAGGAFTGGTSPGGASPGLPKFIIGADISSVDEAMERGTKYADTDGTAKSIFEILKNHGFNFIRLRAFVKPGAKYGYAYGTGGSCIKSETYCDTAHTVAFAKQVKAAGMGLLLDLHYSDNWTDPGNQIIPEDWRGVTSIAQLADNVQAYTQDIVGALITNGARPDIVQVGNEITPGMLIHVPNADTDCWGNNVSTNAISGSASNWTNLGTLLKAGVAGVKSVDSAIKIMVHIENTKSASGVVSWVRNARNQGVAMDIVGLSCYVAFQGEPTVWKAAFDALASAFTDLSFVIAEYNPQRTAANQVMYGMPNGRGLGTFFWEPTQSGEWGSSMFTFSGNTGRANTADFQEFDTIAHDVGLK